MEFRDTLGLAFTPMSKKTCQIGKRFQVGWGATYHAHPVALACAYETVKYMLKVGKDTPPKTNMSH